jgi:hypothetical protein
LALKGERRKWCGGFNLEINNLDITQRALEFDKATPAVKSTARRLHAILGLAAAASTVREEIAVAKIAREIHVADRQKAARERYRVKNSVAAKKRYDRLKLDRGFRQKCVAQAVTHQRRYPLAKRARQLVGYHVRAGNLRPASDFACVDCGRPATDYDHRDYTKPLIVEPTCRSCNLQRGPGHPYNRRLRRGIPQDVIGR